jgi:hypothetical protein
MRTNQTEDSHHNRNNIWMRLIDITYIDQFEHEIRRAKVTDA